MNAINGGGAGAGDHQTPPTTTAADIDAWIAQGYYKAWHCEAQPSVKTVGASTIHVHGSNRICTNDALGGFTGSGEFPVGIAAVKELWDSANTQVNGYAVYVHTAAGDATSCAKYFYYERPSAGATPVIGLGDGVCTGCHGGAGSDAMHLAPTAHDCVYTIIK